MKKKKLTLEKESIQGKLYAIIGGRNIHPPALLEARWKGDVGILMFQFSCYSHSF